METDIDSVKDKQKNLDEKFTHMETNSKFADDRINQLQSSKKEVPSRTALIREFSQQFCNESAPGSHGSYDKLIFHTISGLSCSKGG